MPKGPVEPPAPEPAKLSVPDEVAKKKAKRNKKKKKKANKLFGDQTVYQLHQNNPTDMEALLVLAEEEYLEPSKLPNVTGIMKVRTSKKDYMRVEKNQGMNRFAPEV